MDREQALNEMKSGKKVTHSTFMDDEYVTFESNEIITEDRFAFTSRFFILDQFKTGWKIYEDGKAN